MKYLFILISTIFLFNACSNEFEISEEYKDIPIVYALINPLDTANYIRLEKAFTSQDVSALEIAQNPDSLYYKDAKVSIVQCLNDDCSEVGNSFDFTEVDGNQEGYPRADGVFASAPNTLYKMLQSVYPIIPGEQYQLNIDRGNGLPIVTGSTFSIINPIISSPSSFGKLSFLPGKSITFTWKYLDNNPSPGGISDAILTFRYQESVANGPFESKEIIWNVSQNVKSGEIEKDGSDFFNFFADNLTVDSQIKRVFEKADFKLVSGGLELVDYLNVGLANLGITSTGDIPAFSNMSEGRGIFTSTNVREVNNLDLRDETLDSLRDGHITRELNFQ